MYFRNVIRKKVALSTQKQVTLHTQCSWCLKWGHKEGVCYAKQKGNPQKEKRRQAAKIEQLTTEQKEGMEQGNENRNISSDQPSNQHREKPVDWASLDSSTPPPNQEQFHQQQHLERWDRQIVTENNNETDVYKWKPKMNLTNLTLGHISMTEDD